MNKDKNTLAERREYIRKTIDSNSGKSTTRTVKELADEMFLSESTIWKDLARAYKLDTDEIK